MKKYIIAFFIWVMIIPIAYLFRTPLVENDIRISV